MGRVDLNTLDSAGHAELQNHPVIAGLSSPTCFPAVGHARAPPGQQHVMHRAIVLITARDSPAAVERRGEIHSGTCSGRCAGPVALHNSISTESGASAVRR